MATPGWSTFFLLAVLLLPLGLGAPSTLASETGADCLNGLDDDADGLPDCHDPECGAEAAVGPLDLRVERRGPTVVLTWTGSGPETSHDVAVGALGDPVGQVRFDSVAGAQELTASRLSDPAPDLASAWYLVRAHSPCRTGSHGTDAFGRERQVPGRPGDALESCDRGPTPGTVSAWTECDASTPDELVVHVTNDTAEDLRLWHAECPSTPTFEALTDTGDWIEVPFCVICVNGWADWIPLPAGADLEYQGVVSTVCLAPGPHRASFIVARTCDVSGELALEQCPDARLVVTDVFLIE